MIRGDRRLTAIVHIAADIAVVLAAAFLLSAQLAAIIAVVLAILFVRWWQRTST